MVEVKGRILVVDGDASTRRARARSLRDAGHTVFETARSADASVLMRQVRPHLLILSGELSRTIEHHTYNEDGREIVVLRIAAADASAEAVDAVDASVDRTGGIEADAYLVEPVTPGVLLATTRVLLRLRRAERELREYVALERTARDEADAANRVKDDFLATLSHELRTPLHAIVGWVALLRTKSFDDKTRAHALEVIERNAKVQTGLIEDLLDISRITLGQLRLTWQPVELAAVLFSAIDAIRPTAEAKNVSISTHIAFDAELAVRGDASRLRQVFWILLSNAVKFTPASGRVDIRAHAMNGRVEIEVADTGRGITPEFLAGIFERFHRADSSTTAVNRGLGLGLSIARQLVELHGGAVTAASAGLNRGATFAVTLPRLPAREAATRLWRESGRRAAGA